MTPESSSAASPAPDARPFDTGWLALREPFDLAARADAFAQLDLQAALSAHARDTDALRVLDLGCGTASNFRALAPRIGGAQHWTLVDHDPVLLGTLGPAMAHWCSARGFAWHAEGTTRAHIDAGDWRATLQWQQADLCGQLDALPFAECQLITASALLDLVSEDWLGKLLAQAASANAVMLFSLTVDGRHEWTPELPGDVRVQAQFAAHQQRDKGFGGPALGAHAIDAACRHFTALGYAQAKATSDWQIGPFDKAMLHAMIVGLADAALEQAPHARADTQSWRMRRLAEAADTRLRVGHTELLAWRG